MANHNSGSKYDTARAYSLIVSENTSFLLVFVHHPGCSVLFILRLVPQMKLKYSSIKPYNEVRKITKIDFKFYSDLLRWNKNLYYATTYHHGNVSV